MANSPKITIPAEKVVKEITVEVVVDLRSIERHYFGYFGWRKWLAIKMIGAGARLIKAQPKIRS